MIGMHIEYHKHWSTSLWKDMEMKVYGHAGKPILVFPSSGGTFYEYEDFKMVEACQSFINAGSVQFFTVESVDEQTWLHTNKNAEQRAYRHREYENYILAELVPYIRSRSPFHQLMTTGCSLGAFHALNFLCKYPGVFDATIALSGVYDLRFSMGNFMDDNIYYNSPVHYLANLTDPWFLDQLRSSTMIICSGQGAWEEETLQDTYNLMKIFEAQRIPAWFDIWGHDVSHDWPWWRIQMPYFLDKLGYHHF
jgi:esterase/lipase superfamily enzyme